MPENFIDNRKYEAGREEMMACIVGEAGRLLWVVGGCKKGDYFALPGRVVGPVGCERGLGALLN